MISNPNPSVPPKRVPGAQPGNHNAYKHGRYARSISLEPAHPPKHGFYSNFFTPEEIAWLDAVPTDQFLKSIKRELVVMSFEALRSPELRSKDVPFLIKTILRFGKK
jgi:hypothetical protein